MTLKLFLSAERDDQINHPWRQEATQSAHAFDFAHLVGEALLELLVEFFYLSRSLAQFLQ